MKKTIVLFCLIMAIITFSSYTRADIIWDWSFDSEVGQFLTTGDLVGGTVNPGTYQLLDFSVSSTAAGGSDYEGSISDGTWDYFTGYGAAIPYQLIWDGTVVTEWTNNGTTTYPEWDFQNAVGAGLKRYTFGMAVENYWTAWVDTGDGSDYIGPEWATLIAAEVAPPFGTYVAEGQLSVSPSGTAAPIPEPSTMILFGTGVAGLAGSRLRRKKS